MQIINPNFVPEFLSLNNLKIVYFDLEEVRKCLDYQAESDWETNFPVNM